MLHFWLLKYNNGTFASSIRAYFFIFGFILSMLSNEHLTRFYTFQFVFLKFKTSKKIDEIFSDLILN